MSRFFFRLNQTAIPPSFFFHSYDYILSEMWGLLIESCSPR